MDLRNILFALLFAVASVGASAAVSPVPTRFCTTIGSSLGLSYKVELLNGVLFYTAYDLGHRNPKVETVAVTDADWKRFYKSLNHANVWRWKSKYVDYSSSDAQEWSLVVSYPGQENSIQGYGKLPHSFPVYVTAVQALIGHRHFE